MREGVKLGRLIRLANQAFENTKNSLFEEHGLTSSQADVLDFLLSCESGIATQKDIAAYLHTSYATVSGLVTRLENKGMVVRMAGKSDRRSHAVHITDAARPLVGRCAAQLEVMDERALAGFTEKERAEFVDMLERLVANTSQRGE